MPKFYKALQNIENYQNNSLKIKRKIIFLLDL